MLVKPIIVHMKSTACALIVNVYPLADPEGWSGTPPSRFNFFLSFSCSFCQKSCQIRGFHPELRGWHPRLGNPGPVTDQWDCSHEKQFSRSRCRTVWMDLQTPTRHLWCSSHRTSCWCSHTCPAGWPFFPEIYRTECSCLHRGPFGMAGLK